MFPMLEMKKPKPLFPSRNLTLVTEQSGGFVLYSKKVARIVRITAWAINLGSL